jgi:hypothetical protein
VSVAVNTLADRVRRAADDWPALDVTTAQAINTATAVAVNVPNNYKVGNTICLDQELLYVSSVNGTTSGSTLTVVRGWRGTTAATHASGVPVLINPMYGPAEILDAMNEGLRQLWPFFFKWVEDETTTLTSDTQADYAIPAAFGESGIITAAEILLPGLTNDGWRTFRWFHHLEGSGGRTISLRRIPPVSTKLRLIGIAPFTTDLAYGGNTDAQLLDSGVTALTMYAHHYLQLIAESRRQNSSGAKNLGVAAVQAGQHQALSGVYLQRFQQYVQQHGQRYPTWQTRRRI